MRIDPLLGDGHPEHILYRNVAIYSSVDGTSIISLSLDGPPRCRAPEGWEDVPLDNRAWKWSKLDVLSLNDEVRVSARFDTYHALIDNFLPVCYSLPDCVRPI